MKTISVLVLSLAAAPGFGETRLTPPAPVAPVALYTHFQSGPSDAITSALQDELGSIMAPMGFQFEWRALSGVRGNEVSVELAVLTFKGKCDVDGLVPHSTNPGALGWTHVSDGHILPFSDIDCDRIRGFIQRDLLGLRLSDREGAFGRALARVVAHELYHIFAQTARHGSCGVGKSAYTVRELMGGDFQFEGRESAALRNSPTREALANAFR